MNYVCQHWTYTYESLIKSKKSYVIIMTLINYCEHNKLQIIAGRLIPPSECHNINVSFFMTKWRHHADRPDCR